MKHLTKIIGSVLIVVTLGTGAQGLSSHSSENAETRALKSQVTELQIRLDALEVKVEAMGTARMYRTSP